MGQHARGRRLAIGLCAGAGATLLLAAEAEAQTPCTPANTLRLSGAQPSGVTTDRPIILEQGAGGVSLTSTACSVTATAGGATAVGLSGRTGVTLNVASIVSTAVPTGRQGDLFRYGLSATSAVGDLDITVGSLTAYNGALLQAGGGVVARFGSLSAGSGVDITAGGAVNLTVGRAVTTFNGDAFPVFGQAVRVLRATDVTLDLGDLASTGVSAPPEAVEVVATGALTAVIRGEVRAASVRSCIVLLRLGETCVGANGSALRAQVGGPANIDVLAGASLRSAGPAMDVGADGGQIRNAGRIDGIRLTSLDSVIIRDPGFATPIYGSAGFRIDNLGQIVGDVVTGDGADELLIRGGAVFTGALDMGAALDRFSIQGTATLTGARLMQNVEALEVLAGGRLNLSLGAVSFGGLGSAPSFTALSVQSAFLNAGSTLQMNVGRVEPSCPGCNNIGDSLTASGPIVLGGGALVLQAQPLGGVDVHQTVLLSAGSGLTGRFGDVTVSGAALTPVLSYTPQALVLTLFRNDVDLAARGVTANQRSVGSAVSAAGAASAAYQLVLLQGAGAAPATLDRLSGEAYASLGALAIEQAQRRQATLGRRLREARASGFSLWGDAGAGRTDLLADSGAATLHGRGSVVALGQEFARDRWRAGLSQMFLEEDADATARDSRLYTQSWTGAVYGDGDVASLRFAGSASYGRTMARVTRGLPVDPLAGVAPVRVRGADSFNQADVRLEVSRPIILGALTAEPYLSAAYLRQDGARFVEPGSSVGLTASVPARDLSFARLGLRLSQTWRVGEGADLSAGVAVGYRRADGDADSTAVNRFAAGLAFAVQGLAIAQDAGEAALDLRLRTDRGGLALRYEAELADRLSSQALKLGAAFTF